MHINGEVNSQPKLHCCEYLNLKGEDAHVLGCCCDCEAVDSACDSCLQCSSQVNSCSSMGATFADRARIPWIGGAGAIQVQLDVFVPIFILPTLLVISISHQYVAWGVSICTPLALILYYRCWRNNPHRVRTRFFFSWSLVSVFTIGYVFIGVLFYREILLFEGMVLLTMILLMFYSLYLTKQDPGSLRPGVADSYSRTVSIPQNRLRSASETIYHGDNGASQSISSMVNQTLDGFLDIPLDDSSTFQQVKKADSPQRHSRKPSKPIHVQDIMRELAVKTSTCDKCHVKLPPRANHCNICNQCIMLRDHHCIWLDQCIGMRNHRSFIVTIVLFLAVSIYGLHLSLTTICTPVIYWDFLLLPADCRFVYADLMGAIAYVSCCYTITTVICVILLFIQQLVLISQNITIQEFNQAKKQLASTSEQKSNRPYSIIMKNNLYNRGFKKNWMSFLQSKRHEPPEELPSPVASS